MLLFILSCVYLFKEDQDLKRKERNYISNFGDYPYVLGYTAIYGDGR